MTDIGSTHFAKKVCGSSLRRLVLYGRDIGNATLAEFSSVLEQAPLQEFVVGGTAFTGGPAMEALLQTLWTTKCDRVGILNYNLNDSIANTISSLIRSNNYSPSDILLLAGQATAHAFAVLSECWTGTPCVRRLTVCSFEADNSALDAFVVKPMQEPDSALELVCGRAATAHIDSTLARFESAGHSVITGESLRLNADDPVAAANGVFISNMPTDFLESHVFTRILLRGRKSINEQTRPAITRVSAV